MSEPDLFLIITEIRVHFDVIVGIPFFIRQ